MSVSLTFYGGINEIGGNKILLKDDDKNILLDFGMSFGDYRKYFSTPFLEPRKLEDLIITNLFPEEIKNEKIDAVLVSHAHLDHCKYISLLNEGKASNQGKEEVINFLDKGEKIQAKSRLLDEESYRIPLIGSKETIAILNALYGDEGCKRISFDDPKVEELFTIDYSPSYSTEKYITAFPVEHSIYGATAWIINTQKGAIGYTGDFRLGKNTKKFIEETKKSSPEVLISEGTDAGREVGEGKVKNLEEYKEKIENIVLTNKGITFIDFDYKDLEKFGVIYEIANHNGKKIVVSPQLAHLLTTLFDNSFYKDNVTFLFDKELKKRDKWEKELINNFGEDKIIKGKELQENQSEYIFCSSFYLLKYLVDIKPTEGSYYIISHSEPFNEESEIEEEKLMNWIKLFNLKSCRIHVSGHISYKELLEVIEEINPKILIPIHTEHPKIIKEEVEKLDIKVILPEYGKNICI